MAISYAWITSEHPDLECYHLRRVARILKKMAKLREGWDTHKDVGIFWDFLSLHQRWQTRSVLENMHFKLALSGMQYIYAHRLVCVIKLKRMPSAKALSARTAVSSPSCGEPRRLGWHYEDRGWPTFESAVADLCRDVLWSRMQFTEEDLELSGSSEYKQMWSPLLEDFRYKHATNDPPIHPDRLASLLSTKTFANGSDHEVVLDLYRRTFATMCQSTRLAFNTFWWTREACDNFAEALQAYEQLEEFSLTDGSIGHEKPTTGPFSPTSADPDALRALVVPLASRTALRNAAYRNMAGSAQCLRIFCSGLPPSVQYLSLSDNPVPDVECADVLAEVLPATTPELKTLKFRGGQPMWFGDEVREKLSQSLPNVEILYPEARASPVPRGDPYGLSGVWLTVGKSDGEPNGDRYEFCREGDRYYIYMIVQPDASGEVSAAGADDYFTWDGATARHNKGPTASMLPSGDLLWDMEDAKWLSRREGALPTGGGTQSQWDKDDASIAVFAV